MYDGHWFYYQYFFW